MVRYNADGEKVACIKCRKNHRTGSCNETHTDDVQVVRRGRPPGTGNGQHARNTRDPGVAAAPSQPQISGQSTVGQAVPAPLATNNALPSMLSATATGLPVYGMVPPQAPVNATTGLPQAPSGLTGLAVPTGPVAPSVPAILESSIAARPQSRPDGQRHDIPSLEEYLPASFDWSYLDEDEEFCQLMDEFSRSWAA